MMRMCGDVSLVNYASNRVTDLICTSIAAFSAEKEAALINAKERLVNRREDRFFEQFMRVVELDAAAELTTDETELVRACVIRRLSDRIRYADPFDGLPNAS